MIISLFFYHSFETKTISSEIVWSVRVYLRTFQTNYTKDLWMLEWKSHLVQNTYKYNIGLYPHIMQQFYLATSRQRWRTRRSYNFRILELIQMISHDRILQKIGHLIINTLKYSVHITLLQLQPFAVFHRTGRQAYMHIQRGQEKLNFIH